MTPFAGERHEERHETQTPTSQDAQQQLLKRHSSPGRFNSLRARNGQVTQSDRPLLSQPSVIPGPSYPFPSQAAPSRSEGLPGFLHSVLKPFRRLRLNVQNYTFLDWLQLFLPCVKWLRTYRIREYLLWDIIAGISVGFMVVPQGMSYANIAGVPSVYGLYGAFLPVLVYAVFGSSKELAVGPVAVTSLLISSSLKEVVPGSVDITNPNNPPAELVSVQEMYNQRAIQLSLLVACMYTAVGVFNLGFLTNFLSHSVIGGFTSGAAIIIGLSQLKYILGYNVPRADKLYEQVHHYIDGIEGFVWQEYVMGMTLLAMLLTIKYFGKRYPRLKWLRPLGPISACIVAIIAVVAGNLQDRGIKIVGHIPAGLPSPTVVWWLPMEDAAKLAPLALVVMVVDLLESTSIARALAAKGKYELSANQEIVGLGLANFAGSAFNAYSTTGSFSRSAVNYDSGCKTGLAGCVTGCVVGLVLLVMTPLFEKLPLNVMGAIVISGVSGLFEYEEAVHLFKVRKLDWCVWMCSFLSTMFLGVEIGLAISIGLALIIVISESAFPHTALLGRVGRTTIYRNVKQFPDSQVIPGIAACRVDAAMYFANVAYIHERLRKYTARAEAYSAAAGTRLQYLLLDMSPVTHLDTTGATLLEKLHEELQQQGIQLGLCNPACAVIALLERTGFPDLLGREWIFVRMHDAVQTCLAALISDGQAVRPLSAYDSQALEPRSPLLPGPGPLLFQPPGWRSPDPLPHTSHHYSAPGVPGFPRPVPRFGGFPRARHSHDGSATGSGSGSSPLLPRKQVAGSAGGLSPRFTGDTLLGPFDTPRIGACQMTGAAAAAGTGTVPGEAVGRGRSSSSGGVREWTRAESAPGFRSAGGAAPEQHAPSRLHDISSEGGHLQLHQQGGIEGSLLAQHLGQQQQQQQLLQQHNRQHLGQLHQHLTQHASALWAASAVAAAGADAGVGSGLHHSSTASTPAGHLAHDTAAVGPAGTPGGSTPASAYSGPLSSQLQLQQLSPLDRVGSHTLSTDGALPGAPSSAVSVAPVSAPVHLGGLQLHISPSVLNHPAVLSRRGSLAGEGSVSGPLSTSSSFRRPVSPRTERLLDEVFSASNGPDFLAVDADEGHTPRSHGAMLQLTEMVSDEHAAAHAGSPWGQGGGALVQGAAGGDGSTTGASGVVQAGEVRLSVGH